MAGVNIFERYGIKEVANVYFEALGGDNDKIPEGQIVLFLDTLKVSTIETSAENVSAQGGWGNPKLVTWDYGKEINITLEDAVISWEEMRILLGAEHRDETSKDVPVIRKNAEQKFTNKAAIKFPTGDGTTNRGKHNFPKEQPAEFSWIDMTNGARGDESDLETYAAELENVSTSNPVRFRFFWKETASADMPATELVISPDRYPGTYRVVGDALIRSEKTGNDEAFQFVINKAKLLSEVTLTMQAEGDPSTFNMTLNVLRDEDGNMMRLIKYN